MNVNQILLVNYINLETITSQAFADLIDLDKGYVGTKHYLGLAYFWAHEYRHTGLRDCSLHKRKRIHNEFLKADIELSGISDRHAEIIRKIV